MITISLPYKNENKNSINLLRKQYSTIVRFSYKRLSENKSQKDIRLLIKNLNNVDNLNSWLIQCAINKADGLQKNNKMIFGGKKLFFRRLKGFISNKEYKDLKLQPIMIQGESLKQGNRLFKLDIINNNQIIFKVNRNVHLVFSLPKLRNNYKKLLYKLEQLNNIKQGENGLTYSVRIDSKKIHLMFEEPKIEYKPIKSRYIGTINGLGIRFINNLEKRIKIYNGKLFKVNPAYSSFIGNLIYNFSDPIKII